MNKFFLGGVSLFVSMGFLMIFCVSFAFCGSFVEPTDQCKASLNKCVYIQGHTFSECINVFNYSGSSSTPVTDHGQCWNDCGKIRPRKTAYDMFRDCQTQRNTEKEQCLKKGGAEDDCRKKWMVSMGRCYKFND